MAYKDKAKKIAYNNNWVAENKERITVIVAQGDKEKIKAQAAARGDGSVNAYIVRLIQEDMERP